MLKTNAFAALESFYGYDDPEETARPSDSDMGALRKALSVLPEGCRYLVVDQEENDEDFHLLEMAALCLEGVELEELKPRVWSEGSYKFTHYQMLGAEMMRIDEPFGPEASSVFVAQEPDPVLSLMPTGMFVPRP